MEHFFEGFVVAVLFMWLVGCGSAKQLKKEVKFINIDEVHDFEAVLFMAGYYDHGWKGDMSDMEEVFKLTKQMTEKQNGK